MQQKVQGNWELSLFFSWFYQFRNDSREEKKNRQTKKTVVSGGVSVTRISSKESE